jgi:hypothetical protein
VREDDDPTVLVFDADELLAAEPHQLAWFVAVLGQIPLRVILQAPAEYSAAVAERFAEAGHGDLGRSTEPGA